MKQLIRNKTFETNSSSVHTLSIISEELFEKLKNGKAYINDYGGIDLLENLPNLASFKEEYPDFNTIPEEEKQEAIREFVENNFDGDYSIGYTYSYVDTESETVYDKEGNKQIALSVYIPG